MGVGGQLRNGDRSPITHWVSSRASVKTGKDIVPFYLAELEPRFFGHSAQIVVTILIEQSELQNYHTASTSTATVTVGL